MNQDMLQCSSCAGTDVQKLSMVYQSGTSKIDATTRGSSTGIGLGGIGGGARLGIGTAVSSSKTKGTQMTELAQKAAPPAKKIVFAWVGIGLIAAIVVSLLLNMVFSLLVLAGCGFLAYRGFAYNAKTYPGLKEIWARSWMCHRCGEIFTR